MSSIVDNIRILASNEHISISELERRIKASKGVLSRAISNGSDIQSKWLFAIVENYPQYNTRWLLTGEGEMLLNEINPTQKKQEIQLVNRPKTPDRIIKEQCIPVYTGEVRAGVLSTLSNAEIIGDEWIHIPDMPKCDGAIRVSGTSMMPLLHPGDLIGISRVEPNIILWGQIYLVDFSVDGDEYIVVKRICKSDEGKDYVSLVSDNPEYEPTDIPKHAIRGMAIVKFFIRQLTSI